MVPSQAEMIIERASAIKLPTMFQERGSVTTGALAAYGESLHMAGRLMAKHVQRVLLGANPGDLPIEQVDRLYFSINLDMVRVARQVLPAEGYEILNAGMAYRQTDKDEFQWREHPVWKITVPAQYVGRMIKWLEDNDYISTQVWAVQIVWPVNRPPEAHVRFNPLGGGGWDIALVVLEPFDQLDLSKRVQIENDVVRLDPEFPG